MDKEDLLTIIATAREEKISVLDLSNRDIDELPSEIGTLKDLKLLNLSYNNIQTLPAEINQLSKLESLLLSRNEIEQLPAEIGGLDRLKLLDLSHNPLLTFPEQIGNLSELLSLDASYCKIEKLPIDMIDLLTLKDMYLEGNDCKFPPQNTIKMGLYATMHFLSEEKKKLSTQKVNVQIFNMPSHIHSAFESYIEYFNEIYYASNNVNLNIEANFVSNEQEKPSKEDYKKSTYLDDFIYFLKNNLGNFKANDQRVVIEEQLHSIEKQINKLTSSISLKMNDLTNISTQLETIKKQLKDNS